MKNSTRMLLLAGIVIGTAAATLAQAPAPAGMDELIERLERIETAIVDREIGVMGNLFLIGDFMIEKLNDQSARLERIETALWDEESGVLTGNLDLRRDHATLMQGHIDILEHIDSIFTALQQLGASANGELVRLRPLPNADARGQNQACCVSPAPECIPLPGTRLPGVKESEDPCPKNL